MADEYRNLPLEHVMTAVSEGILRALEDRKSLLQDTRFDRVVITCGGEIAFEVSQILQRQLPEQVGRAAEIGSGLG